MSSCKILWKKLHLFLGIYIGLIIVVVAAIAGRGNLQMLKMVVPVNDADWRATNSKNEIVALPFVIELNSFAIEEYDSGKPKTFTSKITVYTQQGDTINGIVEVNKPLSVYGWKIYQHSYDKTLGKLGRYSVFTIVKDPRLPVVYTGFLFIFTGTLFFIFKRFSVKSLRVRKTVLIALGGIILFSFLTARVWFSPQRMSNLMPALQSIWFIPHVSMYIFAYALLSVAVIYALFLLLMKNNFKKQRQVMLLCDDLVYSGSAFLTMGILIGAIWAKAAWGHYWTWDPKETWAAITWLSFLFYIHFRLWKPAKIKTAICLLFFSYLLLQICWLGVKYLPFLQGNSIHVYR